MTVPREVGLIRTEDEGYLLTQRPVVELRSLRERKPKIELYDRMIAPLDILLNGFDGDTLEADVTFEPGTAREIGLVLRRGEGEGTTVGYDAAQGLRFVDRSRSSSSLWRPSFPARREAP